MGDLRTRNAITIADGATYMLPKLVGIAKAIELIFTGEMIDAKEAERIGLVNKTVPVNKFKEEVMALAHKLAQGPTKIIGIAKAEIYRELNMDLSTALEDQLIDYGLQLKMARRGVRPFLRRDLPGIQEDSEA